MTKTTIDSYFNPDKHLVLHQDKEGNMIGGGYQVNNLLYQHKMPLFVSLDDTEKQSGGSKSEGGCNDEHYIPEKFSDLFRNLAVPAGLFMMPALFRPRNYAFEVPESQASAIDSKVSDESRRSDESEDTDEDTDIESKTVPKDIFDRLLELVTPRERVQHDVKTRRHRRSNDGHKENKKRKNYTKRTRSYME